MLDTITISKPRAVETKIRHTAIETTVQVLVAINEHDCGPVPCKTRLAVIEYITPYPPMCSMEKLIEHAAWHGQTVGETKAVAIFGQLEWILDLPSHDYDGEIRNIVFKPGEFV